MKKILLIFLITVVDLLSLTITRGGDGITEPFVNYTTDSVSYTTISNRYYYVIDMCDEKMFIDYLNNLPEPLPNIGLYTYEGAFYDFVRRYPDSFTDVCYKIEKSCADGYIYDPEADICKEPPPCTDEVPDGWGPYPMAFGSCKAWDDLNASEQAQFAPGTQGGSPICGVCAAPLKAICPPGESVNGDNKCIKDYLFLDIPESDCKAGTVFTDYSKGLTGLLYWDKYVNSCRLLEDSILPCSSYTESVIKDVFSCDTDLNNQSFSCIDNPGTLPTIETSCTPKNQASVGSPCTEARKKKAIDCADAGLNFDENSVCQDNGIVITKDELSCNGAIKPKCDEVWGEVYNSSTNECDCLPGYYKDRFGECSYDFFGKSDENLTDEQKAQKAAAEVANKQARDTSKAQADLNQSLASQTSIIGGLGDGLAGLRSDINTTNNILNDFKDMFDDDEKIDVPETDSTDIDDAKNFLDSVTSQYSNFYDNVKTQINQIEDKYNEALALFNGQRPVYSMPGGSTDNCFSFEVFGRTISLDLCTSLGYFILNIYFMILIFFFSLKYTLRSFQ